MIFDAIWRTRENELKMGLKGISISRSIKRTGRRSKGAEEKGRNDIITNEGRMKVTGQDQTKIKHIKRIW